MLERILAGMQQCTLCCMVEPEYCWMERKGRICVQKTGHNRDNMRLFFDREEVEESERVEDMDLEVGEETSSDATMYSHSVEMFHLCLFHGHGFGRRGRNWQGCNNVLALS